MHFIIARIVKERALVVVVALLYDDYNDRRRRDTLQAVIISRAALPLALSLSLLTFSSPRAFYLGPRGRANYETAERER